MAKADKKQKQQLIYLKVLLNCLLTPKLTLMMLL